MIRPPADLDPRDLFELLSERRPSWPLEARFDAAPDEPLRAVALSPIEWARVRRDGKALLLYGLHSADGPVFGSMADVGALDPEEARRMAAAVYDGLAVCGPTFGRIETPAWELVLRQGAERSGALAWAWDDCADVSAGPTGTARIARPERFWGVSASEVLDGHRLVQSAASKVYERR